MAWRDAGQPVLTGPPRAFRCFGLEQPEDEDHQHDDHENPDEAIAGPGNGERKGCSKHLRLDASAPAVPDTTKEQEEDNNDQQDQQ